jgi:hypothetical protein
MRKTNQFMLEAKQHYIKALVGSRVVLEKVRSTKTKDFAGANLACQRAQANTNSGPIQIAKQQTPWQNGLAGVSDGRMMPAGLADQGHLQVTFGQQGNFMSIMTTVLLLFLCFYCLSLTLLLLLYYYFTTTLLRGQLQVTFGQQGNNFETVHLYEHDLSSSNAAHHRNSCNGVNGLVSEVAVKEILAQDHFVRNILN